MVPETQKSQLYKDGTEASYAWLLSMMLLYFILAASNSVFPLLRCIYIKMQFYSVLILFFSHHLKCYAAILNARKCQLHVNSLQGYFYAVASLSFCVQFIYVHIHRQPTTGPPTQLGWNNLSFFSRFPWQLVMSELQWRCQPHNLRWTYSEFKEGVCWAEHVHVSILAANLNRNDRINSWKEWMNCLCELFL